MIKWIKNSKASPNAKTTKYKGLKKQGDKWQAMVKLRKYDREGKRQQTDYFIGTYNTEKEALKARINYILDLL